MNNHAISDEGTLFPPSVFYIGLQRTGSTFLRNYFYSHPDIHCTRYGVQLQLDACAPAHHSAEEIRRHYHANFHRDPGTRVRMDMYESLGIGYVMPGADDWQPAVALTPGRSFDGQGMWPNRAEICRRIKIVAPEARIILTIRNQVDWLSSTYRYMLPHLPVERSRFLDFMDTLEGKLSAYAGLHNLAIEEYHRQFGKDNVLVLPLEKTSTDLEPTLRRVCAFLDVPYVPYRDNEQFKNSAAVYEEGTLPFQRLQQDDGRPRGRLAMTQEDIAFVRCFYAASNAQLCQLLGEDLTAYGYAA